MAYDLILRKRIPTSFSREGGIPGAVAGGLGVVAAIVLLGIPRARRRAENARYRSEYAHDYVLDKPTYLLKSTQTSPAITMAELLRSRRE